MSDNVPTLIGKGERRLVMVRVIERGEGYYESRDVEASRVYEWRSERVVAEYGTDYTPIIREEFVPRRSPESENAHPWRSLHYFAYAGAPF
jgi:hypothetical protein